MCRKEGSKILQFDDPGSSFHLLLQHQQPSFFSSPLREGHRIDPVSVPHGTTVLALLYNEGVVVAGDRMATEGYSVSERRIEKVHAVDDTSVMAIAGAAGPCMEMIRLFRVELEHYEKLEGVMLSMEGKASKLAAMIKGNLPMAMQGLVVMPIFAGFDKKRGACRIYKYDVAGGQYEETEYHSIGSGSRDARGALKKIFKKDLSRDEAIRIAIEALYDASEGDIATGGPDLIRGIFPTVKVIDKNGVFSLPDDDVKVQVNQLLSRLGG